MHRGDQALVLLQLTKHDDVASREPSYGKTSQPIIPFSSWPMLLFGLTTQSEASAASTIMHASLIFFFNLVTQEEDDAGMDR